MFNIFADIIKDLLPHRELSTSAWVARIMVLAVVLGGFCYGAYNVLVNTTLGEKYNVQRLNTKIPQLTHMELIITRRQVWQLLSELRRKDDDNRAVFLLMLVDKKTRNVVLNDNTPSSKTDVVVWDFEIPVRRFGSIEVVEDIANNLQDEIEPRMRKTRRCMTLPIEGETRNTLKRAIPDFVSTHVTLCPLYTFYNPRLIGSTMVFFRVRPPLETWHYEESLRLTTQQISGFFRDFTIHYEMIYE